MKSPALELLTLPGQVCLEEPGDMFRRGMLQRCFDDGVACVLMGDVACASCGFLVLLFPRYESVWHTHICCRV
jgi:hypothetical protein